MVPLQAVSDQFQGVYSSLNRQKDSVLSPKEHYQQLSEAVTTVLSGKGMTRSTLNIVTQTLNKAKPISQVKEGTTSLNAVVIKGVAIGATFVGVTSYIFGSSSVSAPKRLRSVRSLRDDVESVSSAPSKKTPFDLSPTAKAGIAGSLIAGVAAMATTVLYKRLGEELRTDILRAYNGIEDDAVNQTTLLQSTNEVITKKEASYFNRIFEYYNPNAISHLLLAKGIALDSGQKFLTAQQQYRAGLERTTDPELRNILFFALARSLRLSNVSHQFVEEQINQIAENSPIREIGLLEVQATGAYVDEVFDENGIPFKFKCPITLNVMVEPAFYVAADGRKFYFEHAAIVGWITRSGTCPETRAPLAQNQLVRDDRLVEVIRVWNQFKLKNGQLP